MRQELILELNIRKMELQDELSLINDLLMDDSIEHKRISSDKPTKGTDFTDLPRRTKYPYNLMKIGDSFFWSHYTREEMSKVTNAGRAYFLKMGNYDEMTVRTQKEGEGFRVWVIAKS